MRADASWDDAGSNTGSPARTLADYCLLGVTAVELALLALSTSTFTVIDWIYLSQHLLVLGIALTRRSPKAQDRSLPAYVAVVVAYAYPYAQMVYVARVPAEPVWPIAGLVLVVLSAFMSLASLVTLGRRFGLRPALREDLATTGLYGLVRHPMYLSYVIADIGYNLKGWSVGTVLLVLAGWVAMIYRIRAEERILARDVGWARYRDTVRSRLIPGIW